MSAETLQAAGITPSPTTGGTAVVDLIHGRRPGRTLLIRADMDVLPITGQNDVPYHSERAGVPHAHGHDVPTTILMGVAEILNDLRDRLDGTVKLMFQPAEEGPDSAVMEGTVRAYDPAVRDHIERRIGEVAAGVAAALRAEADVTYLRRYPAMRNDPERAALVRTVADELLDPDNVHERAPSMAGEDLAFLAERVPTCMFNLGVANLERGIVYPPHHPRFSADEEALAVGVRVMATAALHYLNG